MAEQCDLFGGVMPAQRKPTDKAKRNWENGFQKWSNEQALDGLYDYGACGYSSICEYCDNEIYGRPCVRALNAMCRDKRIAIDYTKRNYEEIWRL